MKYIVLYQHKLVTARLKKGTVQWFRLANSARIFVNLCWYYVIVTSYNDLKKAPKLNGLFVHVGVRRNLVS